MSKVVDLLAKEIADQLRGPQGVAFADDVPDVERWRSAARQAGRMIGRHVRTGVSDGGRVWVVDEDREVTPEEARAAAVAIADAIHGAQGDTQ